MGNIPFATAYPQGPNVSMGSNPREAFSINCNSASPTLLSTSKLTFIITDIIVADGGGTEDAQLSLNGSSFQRYPHNPLTQDFQFLLMYRNEMMNIRDAEFFSGK